MPITPDLPEDRFAAVLDDADIVRLVADFLGYEDYGPGWEFKVVHPHDEVEVTTIMAKREEKATDALVLP